MRPRRSSPRRVAWSLVLVFAMLAGLSSARAGEPGARVVATGWWWQGGVTGLPVPAPTPPDVAPGQLLVEGNLSGATALAAIQYELEPNRTNPVLTLEVVPGSGTIAAGAIVLACRTGSAWTPTHGGAWSRKPTIETDHCVNGNPSPDGSTWTFPVGPLQLDRLLDVAIVPGRHPNVPESGPGSTLRLVFDAPSQSSLHTAEGEAPPPPDVDDLPPADIALEPGPVTAPALSIPPAVPLTPIPALDADELGQTATAPTRRVATQPVDTPALPEAARWPGVLALILALGATATILQPHSGSERVTIDGLGRFVAPRDGPAPLLR